MSRSSLSAWACWRDYWGMWNAYNEPQFAPLERSPCHAVRLALAPDIQSQVIGASGAINYNFYLVPGSLIWGFWVTPVSGVSMQLTDISLAHEFFQGPVKTSFLQTPDADTRFPSYFMLPTPHPVVGDGLFSLEMWGPVGTRVYLILGVAEVTTCPVK